VRLRRHVGRPLQEPTPDSATCENIFQVINLGAFPLLIGSSKAKDIATDQELGAKWRFRETTLRSIQSFARFITPIGQFNLFETHDLSHRDGIAKRFRTQIAGAPQRATGPA
jgi:hypothetical protein